jgi:hypothetical protein
VNQKDEINTLKEQADHEIENLHQLIDAEEEERKKRDAEDKERENELERKRLDKMNQEDAARFIQRKWNWF